MAAETYVIVKSNSLLEMWRGNTPLIFGTYQDAKDWGGGYPAPASDYGWAGAPVNCKGVQEEQIA